MSASRRTARAVAEVLVKVGALLHSTCGAGIAESGRAPHHIKVALPLIQPQLVVSCRGRSSSHTLMWFGARWLVATPAPQVECRRAPTLTSTSATAQVAQRLAGKATSCKPAEARRRHLQLAQVQRQLRRLPPRRHRQLRLHRLRRPLQQRLAHQRQLPQPQRLLRLLPPRRLRRRRGLLRHRDLVRHRRTDRKAC